MLPQIIVIEFGVKGVMSNAGGAPGERIKSGPIIQVERGDRGVRGYPGVFCLFDDSYVVGYDSVRFRRFQLKQGDGVDDLLVEIRRSADFNPVESCGPGAGEDDSEKGNKRGGDE